MALWALENPIWMVGGDCQKLDEFFYRVLDAGLKRRLVSEAILVYLLSKISNLRNSNPFTIGKRHYDIGNDLFKNMLDKRMVYSCGYWKNAKNLDQAQGSKTGACMQKDMPKARHENT